ncbi:hypothetical protein FNV43_RR07344 [Rhamnella rubrinervis]|uniref:Uncharacterized protein n=1 Tax=Rhamnella rubrinervis TaxID=2594499 RepID=A0A8K0MMB3_9ROSA|nr:hypothetical protein FNV43_RR07344 [Rhamnella rubrinervis]
MSKYKIPWIFKWYYGKEDDLFYRSYSVKWWDKFDITRVQKAMDLEFNPAPITGNPKPALSTTSTSASSSKSKKELIEMAQKLLQQAEAQDTSDEDEGSASSYVQPKEKSKSYGHAHIGTYLMYGASTNMYVKHLVEIPLTSERGNMDSRMSAHVNFTIKLGCNGYTEGQNLEEKKALSRTQSEVSFGENQESEEGIEGVIQPKLKRQALSGTWVLVNQENTKETSKVAMANQGDDDLPICEYYAHKKVVDLA